MEETIMKKETREAFIKKDVEYRELRMPVGSIDEKNRTVNAVLSSEHPVYRGDGYAEILRHDSDSIDLSRAAISNIPLLWGHNHDQTIGVVENIRLHSGRLRGTLRFGSNPHAKEVWQDVKDGILRNISVGYQVNETDYNTDIEVGENLRAYEVTRWTPLEASIVAIPADPTVGIRDLKPNLLDTAMSLPVEKRGLPVRDPLVQEHNRVSEIRSTGKQFEANDLADEVIKNGGSVQDLNQKLLERKAKGSGSAIDTQQKLNIGSKKMNNYSITNVLQASLDPHSRVDIGYEREISQQLAKDRGKHPEGILMPLNAMQERAITAAGGGSDLIGTDHLDGSFIDLLRNRSAVMSLGVTMLPGLTGNVAIPRQNASASASWFDLDGTSTITETSLTTDSVTLTPKSVAALTNFSHKLILQGTPEIEQLVRADLANVLATAIDLKAIAGDGTSNTPTGITNTAGIGSGTYTIATTPTYADIVGQEGDLAASNADVGSMSYLTTPALMSALKTTDVGTDTGQFVWGAGAERGIGNMNGFNAHYSSNVPAGNVIFGNWSDLIVGHWGVLDLATDPYGDNFNKGNVSVRAIMDVDFAVRHPESFTLLTEALA